MIMSELWERRPPVSRTARLASFTVWRTYGGKHASVDCGRDNHGADPGGQPAGQLVRRQDALDPGLYRRRGNNDLSDGRVAPGHQAVGRAEPRPGLLQERRNLLTPGSFPEHCW